MLKKYGVGEVISEDDDSKKVAANNWTDEDSQELTKENESADD